MSAALHARVPNSDSRHAIVPTERATVLSAETDPRPEQPPTPATTVGVASEGSGDQLADVSAFEPRGLTPAYPPRWIDMIQTVLTALLLAFVFRTFFVEPFIIPTGSMAPTLLGAHIHAVCRACGYCFDVSDSRGGATVEDAVCSLCRESTPLKGLPRNAGDRILVHKWLYDLGEWLGPRRWDVIVFRDPAALEQNYIKRLAALPGETIEIVAGDVLINGRVARRPAEVQARAWQLIWSADRQPATQEFGRPTWRAAAEGGWRISGDRVLRFEATDARTAVLQFDPGIADGAFLDMVAYNRRSSNALVGDFRISGVWHRIAGQAGLSWTLAVNHEEYTLEISRGGATRILRHAVGASGEQRPAETTVLASAELADRLPATGAVTFAFQRLDGCFSVELAGKPVVATSADDYLPPLDSLRAIGIRSVSMALKAEGPGVLELHRLQLERDTLYTTHTGRTERALPGEPFALGADEFFVLGDNSADSRDSREWTDLDPGLPAGGRLGTVMRRFIVGRAAFVYLPAMLPGGLGAGFVIPDVGRARFVR